MEKEKLNKLYDFVIDNDDLTTKDLNDLGFNYRNIRILIDNKKLERIRRGHYRLIDYNAMLSYGRDLLKNRENEKA